VIPLFRAPETLALAPGRTAPRPGVEHAAELFLEELARHA
jgi:hypothetical protein